MSRQPGPVRVLYIFPHKFGAGRICYIAWQQVYGLAAAGAEVLVVPGARPTGGHSPWRARREPSPTE